MFSPIRHTGAMDTACDEMVAVVCDDRASYRTAVVRLLMGCGFEVRAVTEVFGAVGELALTHRACVVVVSLPLTGITGLQAVRTLSAAIPDCQIILMSSSETLHLAALEAGARALVPEDDLRMLRAVLREIAHSPRQVRLPAARPHVDGSPAVPNGNASTNPSS